MRDTNVKMWMKFSFTGRNMSDNEMDKKNGGYIKRGIRESYEKGYFIGGYGGNGREKGKNETQRDGRPGAAESVGIFKTGA